MIVHFLDSIMCLMHIIIVATIMIPTHLTSQFAKGLLINYVSRCLQKWILTATLCGTQEKCCYLILQIRKLRHELSKFIEQVSEHWPEPRSPDSSQWSFGFFLLTLEKVTKLNESNKVTGLYIFTYSYYVICNFKPRKNNVQTSLFNGLLLWTYALTFSVLIMKWSKGCR